MSRGATTSRAASCVWMQSSALRIDIATRLGARGATTFFSYFTGLSYAIGDVDESGAITSADIVYLVNAIFKGGPEPLPEWQSGDVNASGSLTSSDIIYLVNFVFKGGPPPVIP